MINYLKRENIIVRLSHINKKKKNLGSNLPVKVEQRDVLTSNASFVCFTLFYYITFIRS